VDDVADMSNGAMEMDDIQMEMSGAEGDDLAGLSVKES
jgi:hypothetical protein